MDTLPQRRSPTKSAQTRYITRAMQATASMVFEQQEAISRVTPADRRRTTTESGPKWQTPNRQAMVREILEGTSQGAAGAAGLKRQKDVKRWTPTDKHCKTCQHSDRQTTRNKKRRTPTGGKSKASRRTSRYGKHQRKSDKYKSKGT